jgi:glucan biosynthesis protein C
MKDSLIATSSASTTTGRLLFVDNIRTLLTVLVISFHLMITYADTGSWYYVEGRQDLITAAIGAWFLAVTQAYFMGLFLFISAYFVPGSYDRKGAGKFLKDRLIRLGIPVALYSWVIRPLLAYLDPVRFPDGRPPFWSFITEKYLVEEAIFGAGPLWFIEVLLIFSLLYVLWRLLTQSLQAKITGVSQFPGNITITLFAVLLGLVAFGVRIVLPLGWNFVPLNLQFPFFVQYIAFFIVGIIAYRNNWLQSMPMRTGRLWLGIAAALVILFWPMMIGGGALEGNFDFIRGGMHWQAFAYAMWESLLGVGMSISLIYIFRQHANTQGKVAKFLSRNAYVAYLIHEVIIITLAYLVIGVTIYPLFKWFIATIIAVPLCFLLGRLVRMLPYADRAL